MSKSPDTVVARFEIVKRRYLDENGKPVADLPALAEDTALLRRVYRAMSFVRLYDAKRVNMQRTGRMGTSATALGQEAIPIGIAAAMRQDDVLVPAYREDGIQIWRGVGIHEMLIYWGGSERGQAYENPAVAQDLPVAITVGNHALHAAGVAWGLQLEERGRAAVCMFGDGATSKGDVYEAFNVAGVWSLPVVFVSSNNRWAISTPLEHQTSTETIAQKGLAGGLTVLQVDGNDVFAVHAAMSEALTRARSGGGSTFIEALTYRLNDHNTNDDASRYRDPEEVKKRWPFCPLKRLKAYLIGRKLWSEAEEEAMKAEITAEIDAAIERYLAEPAPPVGAMFDYTYASLPAAYAWQREEAERFAHG